ncbi:MAG: Bax inhibitor-1/YccA family protein [Verrucomicrobiales bacterium]
MNIGSYNNPYTVATAQPSARAAFIRNTYLHLAMAVMALIAIEAVFLQTAMAKSLALKMAGGGSMGWLVVLGLFMVASWVANKWAHSDTSRGLQYAGLALFTVAEAAILALPLTIATSMPRFDGVISQALMVTLGLFLGLSAVAFMTKKDFSFLGSVIAIGFIIAGALFGFSLGLIFTVAMILLMAASILYTTSNVMHHYRTDQHVAASLALLSSVATLFWYVLQFFMASRD